MTKKDLTERIHNCVHAMRPIMWSLRKIDGVALDIMRNADWSRSAEIREEIIEIRNKYENIAIELMMAVKEYEDSSEANQGNPG